MEIHVASERAFVVTPGLNWSQLRERAWDKKSQAFSAGIGGLLSRPKVEDVEIVYQELRYEPFWYIVAGTRYVYDRARTYRVPVAAPEVRRVLIAGQEFQVTPGR